VGKSRRRLSLSTARQCTPLTQPFTTTSYHLPSVFSPHLTSPHSAFLCHISDMSQTSSSSFQELFSAALRDFEGQTGTRLVEHPFAKQLETCDSVDSITAILQEQAQIFRKFRGDDGKIMKSVKSSVDVLYTLSISTVLGEGIGLVHLKSFIRGTLFLIDILQPFPPAKAIFAGIAILLAVCLLRSHLHISVTYKSRRLSKMSVQVMTHSSTCLRPLRTFSADLVFIPVSLLRQP
jgi:hypothetical protein